MPRYARLEIWSDLECAGGTRSAIVPDVVDVTTIRDVTADESCAVVLPRSSSAIALMANRRVMRVVRKDASYDEWRVRLIGDATGDNSDTFTYTGYSPYLDLANGQIASVSSAGETLHVFPVLGLTPAQYIDTYVLPALAAAGLTFFSRGTVDPTAPLDITIEWMTPLDLLQNLRDKAGCELRVRRNGTAGYFIDLVTQIGAGAAMPSVRAGKNLKSLSRTRRVDDQVTRCYPRGAKRPDSIEYHSIARVLLVVTGVSGGGATLAVADPGGSITPIAFDHQFDGWFVMREQTGGTYQISNTIKSGQQLVLSIATAIAAGELLQLRSSDSQNQLVAAAPIAPRFGAFQTPYMVSMNAPQTQAVIADSASGSYTWINYDGQFSDWFALFHTGTLDDSNCVVNGAAGRFECALAVAGNVNVGDLAFYMGGGSAAFPPYGVPHQSILWEVTAVDGVNRYLYVKPHYPANAAEVLPTPGGVWRLVVQRFFTSRRITGSVASTQTLNFAFGPKPPPSTLMLLEQRCAGVLPAYVDDPVNIQAPPAGSGIIPRALDRSDLRGEANVVPNPRLGTWANALNPPDGYTVDTIGHVGAANEFSQNTDPAFIKYGKKSWFVTLWDDFRGKYTGISTPPAYLNPGAGISLTRCCVKVSLYLADFRQSTSITFRLQTLDWATTGQFVDLLTIFSPDYSGAHAANVTYTAGQWLEFTFSNIDFSQLGGADTFANRGFQLRIFAGSATGAPPPVAKIYLDAVAIYQVDYAVENGVFVEGSFANALLDAGNKQLAQFGAPSVEYNLALLDLERLDNTPWPEDALTLGGQLDLRSADLGVVDTPRLIRMEVPEFAPDQTKVTLATQRLPLTTVLASTA